MLIDFHTHVFPAKIAARSVKALTDGIYRMQGADYRAGESLACREATVKGLLDSMRTAGVDRSICLPVATKVSQIPTINRYAQNVTRYGNANGKIVESFGGMHPADPNWEAVLESLAVQGFHGFKLHLQFQQAYIDSPEVIRILQKAETLGLYAVFHAGEDIGLPPPVYATPERISHLFDYMCGDHLIGAHLGGWEMWDDVERYLVGTPMLFDTAFIARFISPEQCVRIFRNHGTDKILFGSDSPWEDPAETLAFLQSLPLTDHEMAQITHENALRVLGETVC